MSKEAGRRILAALMGLAAAMGSPATAQSGTATGLALFSLASSRIGGWRLVVDGRASLQALVANPDPRWARLWASGLQPMASANEGAGPRVPGPGPGAQTPRWTLVDALGKVQRSGSGFPDALQIEESLRASLGGLPWDTFEALLRVQPDHGEARLAAAELALADASLGYAGGPQPQPQHESLVSRAWEALDQLRAVPAWPWQVDLALEPFPGFPGVQRELPEIAQLDRQAARGATPPTAFALPGRTMAAGLGSVPVGLATRLYQQASVHQEKLERMAREVLAALASDPASARLQANVAFLLRALALADGDRAERLMGDLSGVVPLPGQAWPPVSLIHAQADIWRRQGRWSELLNQVQAWSRNPDRLFLDSGAWDRQVQREGTLRAYAAMARSWQDGWEVLPGALADLRQQSGGSYAELARLTLRGARLPDAPKVREELFQLLLLPSLPAPAMPQALPPWRIEVRDPKDQAFFKEAFERASGLVQWLPAERRLVPKGSLDRTWRVSLGEEAKGEGDQLPLPENLADLLAAGRPGRLWTASERVAQEPDAPGPRRLRIDLLLQRMPCRALETVLAGDLSRALLGAELKTEDLDDNLWFVEARRAIPALEEHLRRWPMDGERWEALAFWTAFVPTHRGPVELAEGLPSLQGKLPFQLCLPVSIHARVGGHLRRRKAWSALRAWCEPAWEGLRVLVSGNPAGRTLARELAPTLQPFLEAAYTNLGLVGEARLLQDSARTLGIRLPGAR